jgi:dihydrofolate reductase
MKLIVAVDEAGGIAKNGKIPWVCKEDQQMFKLLTIGDKVAMGMNTWSSIRRPLTDRYNMVITRNESLLWSDTANGHREFGFFTLDAALSEADWIIGGEEIYKAALSSIELDQIYISRIKGLYDCDKFFTIPSGWKKASEIKFDNFTLEKWIGENLWASY